MLTSLNAPGQRGVAMMEALVAILVLALGVMGLAGLQTRSLVESRLTNARGNALFLTNDLADRMRLNRTAALSAVATQRYDRAFGAAPLGTAPDCFSAPCNAQNQRNFDLIEWEASVAQLLPGGQAQIAAPDAAGQISVTFRWRNNVLGGEFGAANQTANLMPAGLTVPIAGCNDDVATQQNWLCHQVFVRL
jgi:type IV pilus assembly protein PilV